MTVTLLAAIAKNGVIGKRGKLPWSLPEELAWFHSRVRGKRVLVGRDTFLSLPRLEAKQIGVLSNSLNISISPQVVVFSSVTKALETWVGEEVLVIGGRKTYLSFLPYAQRLELNFIQKAYDGEVYFPLKELKKWRIIKSTRCFLSQHWVKLTVWGKK